MLVPRKFLLLVIVTRLFISQAAFANIPPPITTDIKPAARASHIAGILKDTVVVITGSTCRFTVDTPDNQGVVSTKPTVKELLEEITSKDGSVQQYRITDK